MLIPRTLEGWVEMNPDLVPKVMSSNNIIDAIWKDPKLTKVQKERIIKEYTSRPDQRKRIRRQNILVLLIIILFLINVWIASGIVIRWIQP